MMGMNENERMTQKASFMGKWLWILFWLVIPSTLASLMTNENIASAFPTLYFPGEMLGAACSLVYGLILMKLAQENELYRPAGICCLIAGIINVVTTFISGDGSAWTLVLTIPAAIVGLIGEYNEYMAHSEVLIDVDIELSDKWSNLWKWYIGTFAAMFGSIIVTIIVPIIGMLVALAAMIGLVVVSILKLVYLYRSAQVFRAYS